MKRMPTLVSFLLFLALCATAAYWILQFWRPPLRPMAAPAASVTAEVPLEAAAGLFGGRPTAIVEASNYQLTGVVLADNPGESVAILIIEAKPPRTVRVNAEIAPGVIVSEVHAQYILLSENGIIKRVEMPGPGRAVQQADFGVPGIVPSMPQQPGMQVPRMMAPQQPIQVVNPLPGEGLNQLPGQAMPAPPGQGLPGQGASAGTGSNQQPAQPSSSQSLQNDTGIYLPSNSQAQ